MAKIDLPNVFARAFNTPLLIADNKLDAILSGIGNRVFAGEVSASRDDKPEPEASAGDTRRFKSGGYLMENGIAVFPIIGTMVRRGSWLDAESGLVSYALIRRGLAEMMNDGAVRGIMLEVDSYGGEAGGVFELADWIRDASRASGKPVRVHVNESAASAAYAIASAAEFISTPATGEVGSIGVVCAHVDVSEADKKAGHKWTFIYAGAKKVDGNAHEPLNKSVKTELQADIDFLYEMFVAMVARNRGIDAEAVKSTEAAIYRGEQAVEIGLADAVMTLDEAITDFESRLDLQTANPSFVFARGADMAKKPTDKSLESETGTVTEPEIEATETEAEAEPEANAPGGGSGAAPEATPAASAGGKPEIPAVLRADRARTLELNKIHATAAKHGISFDLAGAIENGTTPEAARAAVFDAMAAADTAGPPVVARTSQPLVTNPDGNASPDEVKAGFDAAIEKQARARGLKV